MDEDIRTAWGPENPRTNVRIATDEVGSEAVEGDETAVSRDGRISGEGVTRCAVRGDTHPLGARCAAGDRRAVRQAAVMHEDIGHAVRVARREVGSEAVEGDETAIGRDGRRAGIAVALCAVRGDAHPLGHASQAVMDPDTDAAALEGDETAVS